MKATFTRSTRVPADRCGTSKPAVPLAPIPYPSASKATNSSPSPLTASSMPSASDQSNPFRVRSSWSCTRSSLTFSCAVSCWTQEGGEDSAAFKQPFWSKGVKYVFGTFCKGSLRTVHGRESQPSALPCVMGLRARGAPWAVKAEPGSLQAARLLYGAEVVVEPVEGLLHHRQGRRHVTGIVENALFVLGRGAKDTE